MGHRKAIAAAQRAEGALHPPTPVDVPTLNKSALRAGVKARAKLDAKKALEAECNRNRPSFPPVDLTPKPITIRRSTEKLTWVGGWPKLIRDPELFSDPTPVIYSQAKSQLMLAIKFKVIR